MDKPIINPLWIYLSSVIPHIGDVAKSVSTILLITIFLGVCAYFSWKIVEFDCNYEDDQEKDKFFKKSLSQVTRIMIVFC